MIDIYIINAIVLVSSIFLYSRNTFNLKITNDCEINISHAFFVCIWFFLLSLEYGLRGNFNTDYEHYRIWFEQAQYWNLENIIKNQNTEKGFLLLNYFVVQFSSEYHIMTLTFGVLTICAYFVAIKQNCDVFWPPILILIGTGIYYGGFNLSTQMLAAGIFALSVKCIYERKPIKYILLMLIAVSIHKSALFLMPFYFVSYVNITSRNRFIAILIMFFGAIFMLPFSRNLSIYLSNFVYDGIYADTSIGGYGWGYLAKFLVMTAFVVKFNKLFDMTNVKEKVTYLGCILCCIFVVFSLQLALVQRFVYYFLFFPMIAYAHIIKEYKGDKDFLCIICVILFTVMQIGWFGHEYYTCL